MTMSGAATAWATSQWRRRWVTLALAALVLTVTGALALGAAMTARRAVDAFDRLRERTSAADLTVFVSTFGEQGVTSEELVLRDLPLIGVGGAVIEERFFVRPVGSELIPMFDIYPIVQRQLLDDPINVPVATAGRMPESDEPGEIALSERLAKLLGISVGESVTFESASIEWVEKSTSGIDAGPLDGPTLTFLVTGITVSPIDFAAPTGTMYLTTAFSDAYAEQIAGFARTEIQLTDQALVDEVIRTSSLNSGNDALDAAFEIGSSQWGDLNQVTDGLRVVAAALWIFAAAAAIAGLSIAALIIRRLARSMSAELQVLSALGVNRSGRASYGALLLVPVIAFASVGTVIGALTLAPHLRLGLAEQVEPDRGIFIDWPAITIGTGLLALVTIAVTFATYLAVRHHTEAPSRSNQRPAVKRPIPITLGVRQALGGRAAVVTATLLVATVVTSIVVGASLNRLPLEPKLWGAGADTTIDFGEREGGEVNDEYIRALEALSVDDRVEALTGTTLFYPEIGGSLVGTLAVDARRGQPILTILAGRSPHTPDEIALGRATMSRLDLELGDDVTITLAGESKSFRIVGQAAFAVGDLKLDDGSAITSDGGSRFVEFDADVRISQILITWGDRVDAQQAQRTLADDGYFLLDPRHPPIVANLIQAERLPGLLAAFFGALGLAFLGYVLAASSRARARHLAVLGALGLRPTQLSATLRWHASAVAVVAVLIGVPGGLVAGRVVWTALAHDVGVGVAHAVPLRTLAVAVAISLLGAIAIAVALGSRLRRLPLHELLRAD